MNKKHALLNFVIFFIFWGIIIFIALPAWALLEGDTDLDAKTIVDRVVAEYAQRHCLLYDSEIIVTWPDREFKEGDRIKLRYVCRFILPILIPPVKNWWMEIAAVFCYNSRHGIQETRPLCLSYTLSSGNSDQIPA